MMLVGSPVTILASKSHLGSYGDDGKLQVQMQMECCYAMCQNSCSPCPVDAQLPRSSWSFRDPHIPLALDMNLTHR